MDDSGSCKWRPNEGVWTIPGIQGDYILPNYHPLRSNQNNPMRYRLVSECNNKFHNFRQRKGEIKIVPFFWDEVQYKRSFF